MSRTPRTGVARSVATKPTGFESLAEELRPGQSIELLKELHILTREGKLNQDSRRKLKQVYHLFQFIEKLLDELQVHPGSPIQATPGMIFIRCSFLIRQQGMPLGKCRPF